MGFLRTLLHLEPPRPTARELADANEMRLKNAKEAAARERQRLIVEWLAGEIRRRQDGGFTLDVLVLENIKDRIESEEPLRATRPRGRPPGPRLRR